MDRSASEEQLDTSGNWREAAFHDSFLERMGGSAPCKSNAASGMLRTW